MSAVSPYPIYVGGLARDVRGRLVGLYIDGPDSDRRAYSVIYENGHWGAPTQETETLLPFLGGIAGLSDNVPGSVLLVWLGYYTSEFDGETKVWDAANKRFGPTEIVLNCTLIGRTFCSDVP
jgi:hypothetical protein